MPEQYLISDKELPIINGRRITAIYAKGFFYDTGRLDDAGVAGRIDCYLCVTEDRYYSIVNGRSVWSDMPNIKLKTLPPVFAELFKYTNSLWYRTKPSLHCLPHGRGDGCIHMKNHVLYRDCTGPANYTHVHSDMGKKMLATLGTNHIVKELESSFGVEYDTVWLRREGNLWYPDTALSTWREGYPFVTIDFNSLKHMRIWHERSKSHLFIERVDEVEVGDEGLIFVNVKDRIKGFCYLREWTNTKKEDPGGIIRYNVVDIKSDKIFINAMIGDKVQVRDSTYNGFLYRINRRAFI